MPIIQAVNSGPLAGGETWANVFHFDANTQTPEELQDVIDRLFVFEQAIKTQQTDSCVLQRQVARYVGTDGKPLAGEGLEVVRDLPGSGGSAALPNEVALVISWRTGVPGRTGRGRTYLPGWPEAKSDAQVGEGTAARPVTGTVQAVRNAALDLVDPAGLFPPSLSVLSRTNLVNRIVLSGYVNNEWDTQRRRGNKLSHTRSGF